jgi:hypothetical protein
VSCGRHSPLPFGGRRLGHGPPLPNQRLQLRNRLPPVCVLRLGRWPLQVKRVEGLSLRYDEAQPGLCSGRHGVRILVEAGVSLIAADAPPERQFARQWTFYIDTTGKIAIDKAVKPATSGQDIVTNLGELKVPERK